MYLNEISLIKNYRNLSNCTFKFNNIVNFVIGENNIGKTNLIELLNIIFNKGKFSKQDFFDVSIPIEIIIKISYTTEEIGFFSDFFDIEDSNSINIHIVQESVDDRIMYFEDGNELEISFSLIKKINTYYYHSQRLPNKELDFSKEQGNGKILNYFVEKSLSKREYNASSFLNIDKISEVKTDINEYVSKISSLTNDFINAYVSEEPHNFISRLLEIGNDTVKLNDLGDGVQYAFNIILSILDSILENKKNKTKEKFNEGLVYVGGKKYFPMLLLLDEPEIHQHPHRQKVIIKKITQILSNSDEKFIELIKELFEIDGIIGQLFVVTHSPNILSNDYKQFIRMFTDNNQIKVISGSNININDNVLKHLFKLYIEIKISFFGRKVLLVEGDTEKGAFPLIAAKNGIDFEERSCTLIQMGGADNVQPMLQIFNVFGIKAYAFLDKDKFNQYGTNNHIFYTNQKDYECEIVEIMTLNDKINSLLILGAKNYLFGLLKKYDSFDKNQFINNNAIPELTSSEREEFEAIITPDLISKLQENKNQVDAYKIIESLNNYPQSILDFLSKTGD